jgi:hypothetical protein
VKASPERPICAACGSRVGDSTGCYVEFAEIEREDHRRVPYGDEGWAISIGGDLPRTCDDCAVTIGGYHHWPCKAERCPVCEETLIDCPHRATYRPGLFEHAQKPSPRRW